MFGEDETPDPKFHGFYDGVVVDNRDPLRVGRVRVRIPGLVEPFSSWALPMANPGGGSDSVGFYFPPKIGAEVGVMFKLGDIDRPRFWIGTWGAPGGQPESPSFVRDLAADQAPQVQGIETDRWRIVFDNRAGQERLVIEDRNPPAGGGADFIEIDGAGNGVTISGTAAVYIKSSGVVNIDAMQLLLNGRQVKATEDPI